MKDPYRLKVFTSPPSDTEVIIFFMSETIVPAKNSIPRSNSLGANGVLGPTRQMRAFLANSKRLPAVPFTNEEEVIITTSLLGNNFLASSIFAFSGFFLNNPNIFEFF